MMHMFKMIYIYILLMFGKDILFPQAYEVLKLLIQLLPVVARNDDVPLAEEKTTFLVKMMAHISTCSQIEYLIKSLLYKHVTCEVIRELDHCLVVRNLFGLTSKNVFAYNGFATIYSEIKGRGRNLHVMTPLVGSHEESLVPGGLLLLDVIKV